MSAHLRMVWLFGFWPENVEAGKLFWLSNYVNIVINDKFSSRSRVKHFICCGKFVNLGESFFLPAIQPSRLWPNSHRFWPRRRRDSYEALFFCWSANFVLFGFSVSFFFWFWPGIAFLSRDESRKMEDFLRLRQARHINYSFRFWFAMPAGYTKKKPGKKKRRKIQPGSLGGL